MTIGLIGTKLGMTREYYLKSNKKIDTLTDFVDLLKFSKENKFIMNNNLESFYIKKSDTLVLENNSFRYSMIKLSNN